MSVDRITVMHEVDTITAIHCDNCSKAIELVFPGIVQLAPQGRSMLHVELSGGYGEFIDGRGTAHLCKDCALKLREAFPLFGIIMDHSFIGGPDWRIQNDDKDPL